MWLLDKLKGRNKNQAGTPEKAGTPSQDGADENQSPTRNVIWNEEIEKLQIKEDVLKSVMPLIKFHKTEDIISSFSRITCTYLVLN